MNYCQIVVIAETENEMRSIISALVNALDQNKLDHDPLNNCQIYESIMNRNVGGRIILKKNQTHDYDRRLGRHLDDMS